MACSNVGSRFHPSPKKKFHHLDLLVLWLAKMTQIFPKWWVKHGDESHGIESVKHQHQNKQNENEQREPWKKPSYFPWNTGCLVGVLISRLIKSSPHNWVVFPVDHKPQVEPLVNSVPGWTGCSTWHLTKHPWSWGMLVNDKVNGG